MVYIYIIKNTAKLENYVVVAPPELVPVDAKTTPVGDPPVGYTPVG